MPGSRTQSGTLPIADFSVRSTDSGGTNPKWKVGWGITARCNMSCSFCYSRALRGSPTELPLESLLAFVGRNHAFIDSINYGTGENTLSRDWYSVVKEVNRDYPGIPQALTTNGYLSPALSGRSDRARILESLSEVDVSLDFHDPQMHNRARGVSDAFRWVTETVAMCRSAEIATTIVMTGTNDTLAVDHLSRLLEIASRHGCYFRINIYRPVGGSLAETAAYSVVKQAVAWMVRNAKVVSLCDPLISPIVLGFACLDGAGHSSLRILPDGTITPSTYLVTKEWHKAHITTVDLSDPGLPQQLLSDGAGSLVPDECHRCPHGASCRGGAIDRRFLWYSALRVPDPYCPYRNGDDASTWRPERPPVFVNGPTVHDGYLPTMIFQP